jgi:hypothetical protein
MRTNCATQNLSKENVLDSASGRQCTSDDIAHIDLLQTRAVILPGLHEDLELVIIAFALIELFLFQFHTVHCFDHLVFDAYTLGFAADFLRTIFADVTTSFYGCQLEEGRHHGIKRHIATTLVIYWIARSTLDALTRSQILRALGTLEVHRLIHWTCNTLPGVSRVSQLPARGTSLVALLLAPSACKASFAFPAHSVGEACCFRIASTNTMMSTGLLAARPVEAFNATFAARTIYVALTSSTIRRAIDATWLGLPFRT